MKIHLLRHGIAAAREDPAFAADSERPLTRKGIKRMRKAARGIRRLELGFKAILTSPLIRARQSAEIVAAVLGAESLLRELAELSPESSIEELLSALSRNPEHDNCLLVGHEPLLGRFAGVLLGGENQAFQALPLKKGGLCCIGIESLPPVEAGELRWMLTPRQLRLLAP